MEPYSTNSQTGLFLRHQNRYSGTVSLINSGSPHVRWFVKEAYADDIRPLIPTTSGQ